MPAENSRFAQRLAAFLVRRRLELFVLGLAITAIAWFPSARLSFDQSIESLYSADNPHLQAYSRSKKYFGGDEFALVAYTDPKLYDAASQQRLRILADRLAEVPGVVEGSVQNLATSLAPAKIPFLSVPVSKLKTLFEGILVGQDDATTAVVSRLESEQETKVPRGQTVRQIRKIAAEFEREHGLSTFVVGEPVQVHDMFRYVEDDGLWLWVYSAGLLLLVILVLFRSIRWTVLPIAVVVATLIWTRAALVWSGMELSMVSSMLNSLVTIIGVATVIHVAVHFREGRKTADRETALREAFAELAPAIFWTCATTAVGFGALASSLITPVQSFGIMMTLASMLVLFTCATLLPGGILLGSFSADVGQAPAEGGLERMLHRVSDGVERHPWPLTAGTAVLIALAGWGFTRLSVETDFSKNFRESSPIVQGLNFVESHLGGAGTWEVNFVAPEVLTPEFLEHVGNLADELRTLESGGKPELTKVMALPDGLGLIPSIPFLTNTAAKKLDMLGRFQPEFIPSLYNPELNRMRIILRALERQPSESKLQLIERVQALSRRHFPEAETTGLFVLLTFLIESLMHDQWVSFVIAAAGIFILMTIAYSSPWIGIISLVPNVFPIILVIGTMGWIGLPINIATAMIASVSMGLTVDSSIHFMSGYRRALAHGATFYEALRETHQGVGRALVFANLALVAGFLVLTASHFIPLVYFGILVSVAMLGGLIGNLLLLPLLLRLGHLRDPVPPPRIAPSTTA